jgi:hypothetical protein
VPKSKKRQDRILFPVFFHMLLWLMISLTTYAVMFNEPADEIESATFF